MKLESCSSGPWVRTYRPADYPAMMALWQACGWEPGMNDTEEVLRQRAADPRGFIVIAERDGVLVGTVMGHMDRGWGWIQRLAVHPEHRRQGIGRLLTQEAEKCLEALGAYRLVLLTRRDSAAGSGMTSLSRSHRYLPDARAAPAFLPRL